MCSLVYNDFISSRNLIGQQFKYYAKSSQNHSVEALDITKNINSFNIRAPWARSPPPYHANGNT